MRRVKLRVTHQRLAHLHPADLADILEDLSTEERQSIVASLDEETAAEALGELDARLRLQIVENSLPIKPPTSSRKCSPTRRPTFSTNSPLKIRKKFSMKWFTKVRATFANF